MKKIIFYILLTFIFYSCSIHRAVTNESTFESVEKTHTIDTTLKFIQPIKAFELEQDLDQSTRLETKEYIFESVVNFETAKRVYTFTPKKDTITERVKLNISDKVIKKSNSKKIESVVKGGFPFWWYVLAIIIFLGLLFIGKKLKHLPI